MSEPTRHRPVCLPDQRTRHDPIPALRDHIPLTAHGSRCQTDALWRIVVAAAARPTTIEAVCADLLHAPHANTVRGHLTTQVPPQASSDLEQQVHAALATAIPDWLVTRPQAVAVDFHDEPYYGRSDPTDPERWVGRGEAPAGTTYFYRCATAYVLQRDVRLTLAVVFVTPADDKVTLLARLLKRVRDRGLRIRAAPLRGKQGGRRALGQGRASYRTTHTFRRADHGALTVPVAVVRTYHRRRSGQRHAAWLISVCLRVADPPQRMRQRSRRRLGIESSYRVMEQVRADDRAECGGARCADGRGPADREAVDPLALAVLGGTRPWGTARRACARAAGPDGALLDARDCTLLWGRHGR